MIDVFVLPLNDMVFFPSSAQPLYIIEPCYIRMIRESLDLGAPIALTFLDPTRPRSHGRNHLVVGVGEPIIADERPDGGLVILVQGLARVRLGRIKRAKPYIVCEAEVLPEDNRVIEANRHDLDRLRKILFAWLERAIPEPEYREAVEEQLSAPEALVETYAFHRIHDTDLKQALLERTDINDRIRILSSCEAAGKSLPMRERRLS